jgi:hypothetical protein
MKIKIYGIIIVPEVLYWCETWSIILTEEQRLGKFENGMIREALEPKREEAKR